MAQEPDTAIQILSDLLRALNSLHDGGDFDLTDSPKSYMANVQRLAAQARERQLFLKED